MAVGPCHRSRSDGLPSTIAPVDHGSISPVVLFVALAFRQACTVTV